MADKKSDPDLKDDVVEDDAEDTKFTERFNKLFHKAMGEREKRLEAKLTKSMTEALGKNMDELRQILVEPPEKKEEQEQRSGERQRLSPEDAAALKRAEQAAKEASEKASKWEKEALAEKQANRKAEERQQLQSLLGGKVRPATLELLVDQLHSKHVSRDEETGNILWKDADGTFVPLKDGVASWAKSDLGKEFAPPREARGAGSRGAEGDIPTKPGTMTIDALTDIVTGSMRR